MGVAQALGCMRQPLRMDKAKLVSCGGAWDPELPETRSSSRRSRFMSSPKQRGTPSLQFPPSSTFHHAFTLQDVVAYAKQLE